MRRLILAALLLAPLAGPARAGSSGKGTAAGAFLRLAPGARGAAMGEALGGTADDAYAAWYNPAGLAFLERVEAAAAHEARFEGLSYETLILAVPVLAHRLVLRESGTSERTGHRRVAALLSALVESVAVPG